MFGTASFNSLYSSKLTFGNCSRFHLGISEGPKENLAKKIVELSRELILPSISFFNESTAANTAIIEKIPMVTPSNDKKVLNLLFTRALIAK